MTISLPTANMAQLRVEDYPAKRCLSFRAARYHRPRLQWLSISATLILCLVWATTVIAQPHRGFPLEPEAVADATVDATPVETLVIDHRMFLAHEGNWVLTQDEDHVLKARSPQGSGTSTSQASPLPSPLEENLSGNFSKTNPQAPDSPCGNFLATLVANATFQQCYPFSVLLLGSKSFFQAQKSLVGITSVLDKSCKADVKLCASYLTGVASQLMAKENCGVDLDLENSIVVQLRYALLSYETLYSATCLRDPTTSAYCFASAVTNSSNAQNTYFYYLPMNASLPTDSSPNCNWCVRETMAIFQANAANRKLPIANTYAAAASEVNAYCGASFVNATMPAEIQSAAPGSPIARTPPWSLLSAVVVALTMQWLL